MVSSAKNNLLFFIVNIEEAIENLLFLTCNSLFPVVGTTQGIVAFRCKLMKLMTCHKRNQIVPATLRPAVAKEEEAWTLKSNVWRRQKMSQLKSYGDSMTFHLQSAGRRTAPYHWEMGKSPAWNCFPNPLLLLPPCSRCISNITAAPPKPPGVHIDHSPKHIKEHHCHFSPHTTLPTNSSFAGHLMSPCLCPTQVGQVQEQFSFQLFPLEIKPLHPLHCSWKSDWILSWFTIYRHSSSLPSSQLFWICAFHDGSYIIPPAQKRMLQIMVAD